MKILAGILLVCSFTSFGQSYIAFRNTLNEASFWFYEGKYDSAVVYFQQAERTGLKFFFMEAHLYSRSLWELGKREKSMEVLLGTGYDQFLLNDTTFYSGMSPELRQAMAKKLLTNGQIEYQKNAAFVDTLHERDQRYRQVISDLSRKDNRYILLKHKIDSLDSVNQVEMLHFLKTQGTDLKYRLFPLPFYTFFLHVDSAWLAENCTFLIDLIDLGILPPTCYARAVDRMIDGNPSGKKAYNAYSPDATVVDPKRVFENSVAIGLSPYFNDINTLIYKRGQKPHTKPLYEYFKKNKQHFNCTIQNQ